MVKVGIYGFGRTIPRPDKLSFTSNTGCSPTVWRLLHVVHTQALLLARKCSSSVVRTEHRFPSTTCGSWKQVTPRFMQHRSTDLHNIVMMITSRAKLKLKPKLNTLLEFTHRHERVAGCRPLMSTFLTSDLGMRLQQTASTNGLGLHL